MVDNPTRSASCSRGAFNLGYIGVSHRAERFLAQWSEHCRRNCVTAGDHGQFVDQRWIDAGVLPHAPHVVLDPGCNVGYWNVDTRPVTEHPDGFRADGWPLRFFHFSGFNPASPQALSMHQDDRPRTLLSEQPALRTLAERYAGQLVEAASPRDRHDYRWSHTAGGLRLDPVIRRILREEVMHRESECCGWPGSIDDLTDVFIDETDDGIVTLLASPGRAAPNVPRLLHRLYLSRPDLQHAFPDLTGAGLDGLLRWAATTGHIEHDIPRRLIPSVSDAPPPPRRVRQGVNVIGFTTSAGAMEPEVGCSRPFASLTSPSLSCMGRTRQSLNRTPGTNPLPTSMTSTSTLFAWAVIKHRSSSINGSHLSAVDHTRLVSGHGRSKTLP